MVYAGALGRAARRALGLASLSVRGVHLGFHDSRALVHHSLAEAIWGSQVQAAALGHHLEKCEGGGT